MTSPIQGAGPAQRAVRVDSRRAEKAADGMLVGAGGRLYPAATPLDQVEPILPSNGRAARLLVFATNGILSDVKQQASDLQRLADQGLRVIGVHNATEGFARDMVQVIGDKVGLSRNRATESMTQLILDNLRRGATFGLDGHSQGAIIISRALKAAIPQLQSELGLEEAQRRLDRLYVRTDGSAAMRFPDGPHYLHVINNADIFVAVLNGVGTHGVNPLVRPGKGAEFGRFFEIDSPLPLPDCSLKDIPARAHDQLVHGPAIHYFDKFTDWFPADADGSKK